MTRDEMIQEVLDYPYDKSFTRAALKRLDIRNIRNIHKSSSRLPRDGACRACADVNGLWVQEFRGGSWKRVSAMVFTIEALNGAMAAHLRDNPDCYAHLSARPRGGRP